MSVIYIILAICLTLYSYSQVDLNLTLINWSPYLTAQSFFTQLGYFMRPTSGIIALILFLLLPTGLILLRTTLPVKSLKKIIVLIAIILTCGYTAFSHDLFNYIFDARMITLYGQNPYMHKALDFPQDDWIRFMQWTHRTYPYGPTWLLLTLVPSFLGMQKFLPTYILFKLLFMTSYLLAAWSIYRIMRLINNDEKTARNAIVLFAFQPLILIEGLLSPHLDAVMGSIGILGLYFAFKSIREQHTKNYLISALLILFSGLIKFATLPWLLIANPFVIKKYGEKIVIYIIFAMSLVVGVAQAISQTNYQPWYGLLAAMTLPILTPYVKLKYLVIAGILLAVPMWIYVVFAYIGEWTSAIPIF